MMTVKNLIADVKAAIADLEQAEAGWLPHCDDPEDGCAEVWGEQMADFAKAAVALLSWPTGKWDAEATARAVERYDRQPFAEKQAEDRLHRMPISPDDPRVRIIEVSTPVGYDETIRKLFDECRPKLELDLE